MYATVQDLRDQGISPNEYTDPELADALEYATAFIDLTTGTWFEPRRHTAHVRGGGTRNGTTLEMPAHVLVLDSITAGDIDVTDHFDAPEPVDPRDCATLHSGCGFDAGTTFVIRGLMGCAEPVTDDAGNVEYRTPRLIRRACMRIAVRELPKLGDVDAQEDRKRVRLATEATGGHSVTLTKDERPARMTGDPDVDRILAMYMAAPGMGAV